jgi:hypothetical protein
MRMSNKLIFLVLIFGCAHSPTCFDYCDKEIRKDKYNFCINKKYYENRYCMLEGFNSKGLIEKPKTHFGLEVYNAAEIGDTIKKISGKTEIILVKKDTTIIFPCLCGGMIVE